MNLLLPKGCINIDILIKVYRRRAKMPFAFSFFSNH